MELFTNRKDEQYLSKLVKNDDILANDANLSVSSYVEQEDTREVIDIKEVNAKLETLIAEGNELNKKIEDIIKEIGGNTLKFPKKIGKIFGSSSRKVYLCNDYSSRKV